MTFLKRHHPQICRQWFEQIKPIRIDPGLLQLYTPTVVKRDYLQKRCMEEFREAAQHVTGQLIAVRFTTDPKGDLSTPTSAPTPTATPAPTTPETSKAQPRLAPPSPDAPITSFSPDTTPSNGDGHPASTTSTDATDATQRPRLSSSPPARPAPRPIPVPRSGEGFEPFEDSMVLSPDYSFDTFIPGPNNDLAYAGCVAVADTPGKGYNPLFIHGPVGLGKTHLLQAICQQVLDRNPDARILYVSCDAFIHQFINCVEAGRMTDFRDRYRHVDMLVIDDIHFLGGYRERSQEEFFHTFNALHQSHRQIVLSSDAAPTEIPDIEKRLVSRFQWGLVATLTPPTYETRVAILKAKARIRQLDVPDEVLSVIATKIDSNARELEGAITTLQAHANLYDRPIDLPMTREALGDAFAEPRGNQLTLVQITDVVTSYYNLQLKDLQSRRRHKSVTEPRQICMWLARKRTRFSLEEIGGFFGGRDHTTVIHSIRTVDNRRDSEPEYRATVDQLDQHVSAGG